MNVIGSLCSFAGGHRLEGILIYSLVYQSCCTWYWYWYFSCTYWYLYLHAKYWYLYWFLNLYYWYW